MNFFYDNRIALFSTMSNKLSTILRTHPDVLKRRHFPFGIGSLFSPALISLLETEKVKELNAVLLSHRVHYLQLEDGEKGPYTKEVKREMVMRAFEAIGWAVPAIGTPGTVFWTVPIEEASSTHEASKRARAAPAQ